MYLKGVCAHFGAKLYYRSLFQKQELDDDRRKAISDKATRMYREEPDLFQAATKEYEGTENFFIYRKMLILTSECDHPKLTRVVASECDQQHSFITSLYIYVLIILELPKDHQIHDLASLVNVDKKNFDAEKLGVEAVKEQQAINLKNSSNETAFIPEDQAQVMLAGVSNTI